MASQRSEGKTMRAVVIYESMYGNTRAVAEAIAQGIGERLPVETVEIGAAPVGFPPDVALVVVGGPTHAHGLTTAKSRADAAGRADGGVVSPGIGLREWLDRVEPGEDLTIVAFDTRIKGPELLWGSAAKGATKRLRARGFGSVGQPRSFVVEGPTGPPYDRLPAAELERAQAWGAELAAAVRVPVGVG